MNFHYILIILNNYFDMSYWHSVSINMFDSYKGSGAAEVWRIQEYANLVLVHDLVKWHSSQLGGLNLM